MRMSNKELLTQTSKNSPNYANFMLKAGFKEQFHQDIFDA